MPELQERTTKSNARSNRSKRSNRSTRKATSMRGRRGRNGARSKELAVEDVFEQELLDIADAEDQFVKFLPKVATSVEQSRLQSLFGDLEEDAQRHRRNLQRVRKEHGNGSSRRKCEAMRGLVREATKGLKKRASFERDLLTITNLQKMYHYAIASYGSLRAWSAMIDDEEAEILFRRLTEDDKQADRALTKAAEEMLWSRQQRR